MSIELDKIRERIRQLRKMTTENGCTEAEAMSATEIALRLMSEYGLRDDQIENEHSALDAYGRRRTVADELWNTVAFVCRCQGWYRNDLGLQYVYYGHPNDLAIAEYLHELLRGALRRESAVFKKGSEYLRRRKRKTRNAALKAFHQAMVGRLSRKLMKLWWTKANASGDYVAFEKQWGAHRDRLLSSLVDGGMKFGSMGSLKLPDRRYDHARYEGVRAADRTSIDPGVSKGDTGLMIGKD